MCVFVCGEEVDVLRAGALALLCEHRFCCARARAHTHTHTHNASPRRPFSHLLIQQFADLGLLRLEWLLHHREC